MAKTLVIIITGVGSLVAFLIGVGIWQGTKNPVSTEPVVPFCNNIIIWMQVDDEAILYVNGERVLNATDYRFSYSYSYPCVTNGTLLIAVSSIGGIYGGPNGFVGSIFYVGDEISYTGDGFWIGVDGDATGNWKSNYNYDDSGWIPIDSNISSMCSLQYSSTYFSYSKSKQVGLPNCDTGGLINSFRLKVSLKNGTASVSKPIFTSKPCQSLIIRSKYDDFGELYVNGKFIFKADKYYVTFRYSIGCPSGEYLIAILAYGLESGINGYGISVSLDNTEISYTGDGKWKAINGNATGDWKSKFSYDDSSWTILDSNVTETCKPNMDSTGIPNSQSKYVGLPNCKTPLMINSVRLKITV